MHPFAWKCLLKSVMYRPTEAVRKQRAQENIWTNETLSNRSLEENCVMEDS
jgi:hypothetical protein